MLKSTFLVEVKKGKVPEINGYRLYYQKRRIKPVNEADCSETIFKNLEDAYENAMIADKKMKEIVEQSKREDMFKTAGEFILDDGGIQII